MGKIRLYILILQSERLIYRQELSKIVQEVYI